MDTSDKNPMSLWMLQIVPEIRNIHTTYLVNMYKKIMMIASSSVTIWMLFMMLVRLRAT